MGLSKRFKFELVAEWRAQCVQYKGLQRLAEDVLGLEGHEREAALCLFMSKATLDMRKVGITVLFKNSVVGWGKEDPLG